MNTEFNDGPFVTIPGTRRTIDGRLVELRDAPDGYVYVERSHRVHGPGCGHEVISGRPVERSWVIEEWGRAPEHPIDPVWCTNCMAIPVDDTPNTQPVRQPERIWGVASAARPILEQLFGAGRSVIDPECVIWSAATGAEVRRRVTADRDPGRGTLIERLGVLFDGASRPAVLFVAEAMVLRQLPLANVSAQSKIDNVRSILTWLPTAAHEPADAGGRPDRADEDRPAHRSEKPGQAMPAATPAQAGNAGQTAPAATSAQAGNAGQTVPAATSAQGGPRPLVSQAMPAATPTQAGPTPLVSQAVPEPIVAALQLPGVFNGGAGYNKGLWRHLRWFAALAIALDAIEPTDRAALLADPWRLRDLLGGELADPPSIRNTVLALAFPDTFDFVINDDHKLRIRAAFAGRLPDGISGDEQPDVDRDLDLIRQTLSQESGGRFVDFYAQPWKSQWFEVGPPAGAASRPGRSGSAGETGHSAGTGRAVADPGPGVEWVLPGASAELVELLHMPDDRWLNDVIALLAARKQIILYGPPGTGKTYIARAIGRHVAGQDLAQPDQADPKPAGADPGVLKLPSGRPACPGHVLGPAPQDPMAPDSAGRDTARLDHRACEPANPVVVVQFHPSYAYEDFFEGLRPVTNDQGQLSFEVQAGPLRRLAKRAAADASRPHVLIIDEINRANIAKVFGELYYLLEYRDERIALQYSPNRPFALPSNLFVIGTMNTADRSIALVDAAIRRRFSFVEMHPSEEPVAGLLERFISDPYDPRPALLRALNAEIGMEDWDFHVGPSYLMRFEADSRAGLERVWRHDILPLLEEHYYGRLSRTEVADRFDLAAIARAAELERP